jgi:hypothetical protein
MSRSSQREGPQRFVMNSAVLTQAGLYRYRRVSHVEAIEWLDSGPYRSLIGWPITADAMQIVLGVRPEINRRHVTFNVGDEALVFRLTFRVSDRAVKSQLTPEFVAQHCEIGVLTRIE